MRTVSPVQRPTREQVAIFPTAFAFRAWLDSNHDTAPELFVGYYRAGARETAMTYPESVDEALCYGWIDGITYRVDEEVRATRFTPRRRGSNWSAINIAKIAELTAAGRMHAAGTRAFEERDRRKDAAYSYEREPRELPAEAEARIRANAPARRYWENQTPSYRRTVTYWITSAKREETRERRLDALIADSAQGRMVKPFRIGRDPDAD